MKILLINYRYFISGGPERYLFNVKEVLEENNHRVIPFSIKNKLNNKTPYEKYFIDPIDEENSIYYREHSLKLKTKLKEIQRLFYSIEVERALQKLIKKEKPDIGYILHYLRKLSPAVLVALKKQNIPIIVRLSDYAMICPQSHCYRNEMPCNLCNHGNLFPSIQYACLQKSRLVSLANLAATCFHRVRHLFDLIDGFVVPTKYMYNMMIESGISGKKIKYIPTFVNEEIYYPSSNLKKEKYFCYSGRIEELKGLHILIKALAIIKNNRENIPFHLKIAGTGNSRYIEKLKIKIFEFGLNNNVEFLGDLDQYTLNELFNKSLFSVVPSLWYENLPNTLLESYAAGTPVLASRIGSLSESIIEGHTGLFFNPGDSDDLAQKIIYLLSRPSILSSMSKKSRKTAVNRYSRDKHLNKLESLFYESIRNKK